MVDRFIFKITLTNITHHKDGNSRHNITSHLMPIIKKMEVNKSSSGSRKSRTLAHGHYQCKLIQSLWNIVWRFPHKTLLCRLLPPPLSIYTKEISKAFTSTSNAHCVIFPIAKLWNNTERLSLDEYRRYDTSTCAMQCLCLNNGKHDICNNGHDHGGYQAEVSYINTVLSSI